MKLYGSVSSLSFKTPPLMRALILARITESTSRELLLWVPFLLTWAGLVLEDALGLFGHSFSVLCDSPEDPIELTIAYIRKASTIVILQDLLKCQILEKLFANVNKLSFEYSFCLPQLPLSSDEFHFQLKQSLLLN